MLGDYDEAKELVKGIIKKSPNVIQPYETLALISEQQEEDIKDELKEELKKSPGVESEKILALQKSLKEKQKEVLLFLHVHVWLAHDKAKQSLVRELFFIPIVSASFCGLQNSLLLFLASARP